MRIRQYSTPGEYLEENQAYLRFHEVEAQLNTVNALAHREEPCGPGVLFGQVEDQGNPILLFGQLGPRSLCLDDVAHSPLAVQAAQELARWLKEKGYPVPGVTGREPLCRAFLHLWGGPAKLQIAMDAMVLRHLQLPTPKAGRLRLATPQDRPLLTRWIMAFNREAAGEEMPREIAEEKFQQRIDKGTLYVFETPEGQVVFMATTVRRLPHGFCIAGVYTDPAVRNQGYCQWAMAQLCQFLLDSDDEYVGLFVDKANPISNRAYQKIGFQIVEDQWVFRFEKEETA